jgi:hypothetical protein
VAGPASPHLLRARALQALAGSGDPALGQWEEWTGRAFHIRRRLTPVEAKTTGPMLDIRGTPEQQRRFDRMRRALPAGLADRLGPL